MDQENNTPSKLSTRHFPPNRWQFLNSVHYVPKPRRKFRIPFFYLILLVIASICFSYVLMYVLERAVG
jgi:hypothetical protein